MFVVRTPRGPEEVVRSARSILATLDSALPIAQVGTLQGTLDDTVAEQRLLLRLFVVFAGATLLVAAVGVYGVRLTSSAVASTKWPCVSRSGRARLRLKPSSSVRPCRSLRSASCWDW